VNLALFGRHEVRHIRESGYFTASAVSDMANEFRFEDHPDAIRFKPVTDEAINSLAVQYGLEFSADYLAFLKAHNGVNFDLLGKAAPLAPGIETFDSIRYLFGVDTGFNITICGRISRYRAFGKARSALLPIRSARGRVAIPSFRFSRADQKARSTSSTTRYFRTPAN
jgi:hypothetical protein